MIVSSMKFYFCIKESRFVTTKNLVISLLSMTEAVRGLVDENYVNKHKLFPYIIEFIFYNLRKNLLIFTGNVDLLK